MKRTYNFEEMAEIFAQAVKVEKAAARYDAAAQLYAVLDVKFCQEYESCGWTFRNATPALHDLFDQKETAIKNRNQAMSVLVRVAKRFAALIGVDENVRDSDYYETQLKHFVLEKWYYKPDRLAEICKSLTIEAAKRIYEEEE